MLRHPTWDGFNISINRRGEPHMIIDSKQAERAALLPSAETL